jgi:hypothetical protein
MSGQDHKDEIDAPKQGFFHSIGKFHIYATHLVISVINAKYWKVILKINTILFLYNTKDCGASAGCWFLVTCYRPLDIGQHGGRPYILPMLSVNSRAGLRAHRSVPLTEQILAPGISIIGDPNIRGRKQLSEARGQIGAARDQLPVTRTLFTEARGKTCAKAGK